MSGIRNLVYILLQGLVDVAEKAHSEHVYDQHISVIYQTT